MAYVRKTADEYVILANYGSGWERELTENSLKEAKEAAIYYIENAHGAVGVKIVKRRIRKEHA